MYTPMLFPYWAFISLTALEDEKKLNCFEVSSILYYTVEMCSFLLRMDDWTCILPCAPSREPVSVLLPFGNCVRHAKKWQWSCTVCVLQAVLHGDSMHGKIPDWSHLDKDQLYRAVACRIHLYVVNKDSLTNKN